MNKLKKFEGFVFSLIFHVVVGLILLSVGIDLSPEVPKFFDLTFTVVRAGSTSGETYTPLVPRKTQPAGERTTTVKKKEIVDLPKRAMTKVEEPEIPIVKKDKLFAKESPARLGDKVEFSEADERESTNDIINILGERIDRLENNNFYVLESTQTDDKEKYAGANIFSVQSYMIEWVGGTREKVRGNLPEYPEGFNKTAVIRLRFKIFPNGTVGETIPLQKGNMLLENLAIKSLKTWNFNPLEKNAPQIMQEGIITFIYRLE